MSRKTRNIIFSQNTHPDESLLWKYSRGELKGKEKHDVENHLLDCPMCRDIAEGFSYYKTDGSFNASRNRASELFADKLSKNSRWKVTRLLLAASFLILAAVGYLFLNRLGLLNTDSQQYISRNEVFEEETLNTPNESDSTEKDIVADRKNESSDELMLKEESKAKSVVKEEKKPEKSEEVISDLKIVQDDEQESDIDIDSESDEDTQIEVDMSGFEEEEEEELEPISFALVEEKPTFPGGQEKLLQYLSENTNYPEKARDKGIEGKVYVQFEISESGDVKNVNIARGVDPKLNEEAKKTVSSLPDWEPGKQRGKNVAVTYIVPINFSLDSDYEMPTNSVLADTQSEESDSDEARLAANQPQQEGSTANRQSKAKKSEKLSKSTGSVEAVSREPEPASESSTSDFNRARQAVTDDNLKKAVRILNRLEPGEKNYWDGMWLKADCLLKLDRDSEALELYRRISNTDNPYQQNAKTKIDSLSNQ